MCGTAVSADALTCPRCGRQLRPLTLPPSPPVQPAPPVRPIIAEPKERIAPSRPTGVSALTVLMIIGGIIDLGVGAFSLVVASLYLSWLGILAGVGPTGLLLSLVSFGSFIAGILSFILAYGLWKGRGWAWTWTFIFSILGLIISVIGIAVGIGIIGIVIYAVIIYYLTRARVKTFFGKGVAPVQPTPAIEPTPSRAPESRPSVRVKIPRLKNGKYKIMGLVILALLVGVVSGYSFKGPAPQTSQQATVYVTQYTQVTLTSREYRTLVSYVSVTQGLPQTVTVYVTRTVTQQASITTTTPTVTGPYVLIKYSARTANSISFWTAASGNTFLIVTVMIENHGYEKVYVSSSLFYVIVGNQQFTSATATYALSGYLPSTDVFDGLTLTGSIAYEVPADYRTFSLLYKPLYGQYNIQYVPSS